MKLTIGTTHQHGDPFRLPSDFVARTLAIIGQRGSGKSTAATVIAEELCKQGLPWMALDPVGVWWGLRAAANGEAKGFPVVVFGGQRGDLPLDKGSGRKIAEACIEAAVFAVLDLSQHSKTVWRMIVRDFVGALQELRPQQPRHVFLEETPEFIPQKASHLLGEVCKEICERLVRLGRNWGYGATLLSQRPATIDKDALSQVDNLLVMRTSGAHDRKALRDWITAHAVEAELDQVLDSLASLPDGGGWLWSPQWLKILDRIQIRRRETFHPGETRTVGAKAQSVELADVGEFVAKVRKELTKTQVVLHVTPPLPKNPKTLKALSDMAQVAAAAPPARAAHELSVAVANAQSERDEARAECAKLREELGQERGLRAAAERRLEVVRALLKPEYDTLRAVFEGLGQAAAAGGAAVQDLEAWKPWFEKAANVGCRGMLELLVQRSRLKQVQLATLAGVKFGGSTWRNYRSWMTRNHLATIEGDEIAAAVLA
jgi:hypothetical protein